MSKEKRYQVVDGSQSAHCCFRATVVDTTRPYTFGGSQLFEPICECFEDEDAEQICAALNAHGDLAQMLRDAYMASAYSNYRSWGDGHSLDQMPQEEISEIEQDATEYAKKIMGGQG